MQKLVKLKLKDGVNVLIDISKHGMSEYGFTGVLRRKALSERFSRESVVAIFNEAKDDLEKFIEDLKSLEDERKRSNLRSIYSEDKIVQAQLTQKKRVGDLNRKLNSYIKEMKDVMRSKLNPEELADKMAEITKEIQSTKDELELARKDKFSQEERDLLIAHNVETGRLRKEQVKQRDILREELSAVYRKIVDRITFNSKVTLFDSIESSDKTVAEGTLIRSFLEESSNLYTLRTIVKILTWKNASESDKELIINKYLDSVSEITSTRELSEVITVDFVEELCEEQGWEIAMIYRSEFEVSSHRVDLTSDYFR